MNAGNLIVYHGCDVTVRDDLVSGRLKHLTPSNNKYDWLGPGAYFFEGDFERALLFAEASSENPTKRYTAKPIATPAVVGAVLQVQNWLDMTMQSGIREYSLAFPIFAAGFAASNKDIPVNSQASPTDTDVIYRALDNAVFTWLHEARETHVPPLPSFQAVRGAFHQGKEIAPTSNFRENTHIQIALRDNNCVVGWFLPPGVELLSAEKYVEAKVRLDDAVKAYVKPRMRVPNPRLST